MVYTPPKYPNSIPSAEDLPDRIDDVDWLYAARYNELKKELRAIMLELGVLPKGEHADVKTRLDAAGGGFTDRPDPTGEDFSLGNLTTDGAWHDLDLSAIISPTAKVVLLNVYMNVDMSGRSVQFRKNGNIRTWAISQIIQQVADRAITRDCIVACDTNSKIEFKASNYTWQSVSIVVKGWWE